MKEKLYMQIYDYYKSLIETGKLDTGTKLPSIRRLALERKVSRTTVEQAYMCLCDDGYIIPKSQSGYYVSARRKQRSGEDEKDSIVKSEKYIYDFASSGVDPESFDLSLWRRYIKSALRQTDRLLHYGDAQGEEDLREAVSDFARESRNCICTKSDIVIGAGVQTLLQILCPLLEGEKSICFDDISYVQGTSVFRNYGFKIVKEKEKAAFIYTSPSFASHWGNTMQIADRFALIDYARRNNKIIIEDDYGSEYRYLNRPTPSLQGLDGGENVIYIGTFSKLLLPSIRISYMILPEGLKEKYIKTSYMYNQTVSRAEQIALCSYIRDGHLSSQIRKSRKIYSQKSAYLAKAIKEKMDRSVMIMKTDSPLFLCCSIPYKGDAETLLERCRSEGLNFILMDSDGKVLRAAFSVSSISTENMDRAVEILGRALGK